MNVHKYMFNFLRKKGKTELEKFHEAVYATAFPGGSEQIKEEVALLKSMLEENYTEDVIESILLQSTCILYMKLLDVDKEYSLGNMIDYLIVNKKMRQTDARIIARHLINKHNAI